MRLVPRALARSIALCLAAAIQLAATLALVHPLEHVGPPAAAATSLFDGHVTTVAITTPEQTAAAGPAPAEHDTDDPNHCWLCHLLAIGKMAAPGHLAWSAPDALTVAAVDLDAPCARPSCRAFRARAPPGVVTVAL